MATYEFWFNVVETNKGYFEANSPEEAEALLEQVRNYNLNIDDLPGIVTKNKGIEIEDVELGDVL